MIKRNKKFMSYFITLCLVANLGTSVVLKKQVYAAENNALSQEEIDKNNNNTKEKIINEFKIAYFKNTNLCDKSWSDGVNAEKVSESANDDNNSVNNSDVFEVNFMMQSTDTKYVDFKKTLPSKSTVFEQNIFVPVVSVNKSKLNSLGKLSELKVYFNGNLYNVDLTTLKNEQESDKYKNNEIFTFALKNAHFKVSDLKKDPKVQFIFSAEKMNSDKSISSVKYVHKLNIDTLSSKGDLSLKNTEINLQKHDNSYAQQFVSELETAEANLFKETNVNMQLQYNDNTYENQIFNFADNKASFSINNKKQLKKVILYWMDENTNLHSKEVNMPVSFKNGTIITSADVSDVDNTVKLDFSDKIDNSNITAINGITLDKKIPITNATIIDKSKIKNNEINSIKIENSEGNFTYQFYADLDDAMINVKYSCYSEDKNLYTNGTNDIYLEGLLNKSFDEDSISMKLKDDNGTDYSDYVAKSIKDKKINFAVKTSELSINNKYTLTLTFKDEYGVVQHENYHIFLYKNNLLLDDTDAKNVSLFNNDTYYMHKDVDEIQFKVKDDNSCFKDMKVTEGSEDADFIIDKNIIKIKPKVSNKKITANIIICDKCGNSNQVVVNIFKDTNKPTITKVDNDDAVLENGVYYLKNNIASIKFNIADNESGIKADSILLKDKDNKPFEHFTYENGILTISNLPYCNNSEPYVLKVTFKDNAGNETDETLKIYNDNTLPKLGLLPIEGINETLYYQKDDDNEYYVKGSFYAKKDASKIRFKLSASDDGLMGDIFHLVSSKDIKINDKNVYFDRFSNELCIDTTYLNKFEENKLEIRTSDIQGHEVTNVYYINVNQCDVNNDVKPYNTDRINISVEGQKDDGGTLNENLSNIFNSSKNVIQLKHKLKDDKLDIKMTKNEYENEKLKLSYEIKNKDKTVSGNVDYSDENTKVVPIKLSEGSNVITYTIHSTNGTEVKNTIELQYDTDDIEIKSISPEAATKFEGFDCYKQLQHDITIKDKYISEITKITITGYKNGEYFEQNILDGCTKSEDGDTTTYSYKSNFSDGIYKDVKINAISDFDNRYIKSENLNNFIIDSKEPLINYNEIEHAVIKKENGKDVVYVDKNSNDVSFNLNDTGSLINSYLKVDLVDSKTKKETALSYSIENGKLIFKNIPVNTSYDLNLTLTDILGNKNSYEFTLCNDKEAPVLTPTVDDDTTDGGKKYNNIWYLEGGKNNIKFKLKDNYSGVDLKSLKISYSIGNDTEKKELDTTDAIFGSRFYYNASDDGMIEFRNVPEQNSIKVYISCDDNMRNNLSTELEFYNDTEAPKNALKADSDDISTVLGRKDEGEENYYLNDSSFYIRKDSEKADFKVKTNGFSLLGFNDTKVNLYDSDNNDLSNHLSIVDEHIEVMSNTKKISLNDIKILPEGRYTLRVKTINHNLNEETYNYFIYVCNKDVTADNTYGSDRITVGLKAGNIYEKDFADFDGVNKPENNAPRTIELANKIDNDEMDFKFQKHELSANEKIKIKYDISNSNGSTSGEIDYLSGSDSTTEKIHLIKGTNTITYEIYSTNGSYYKNTLTVNYDPEDMNISVKNDGDNDISNDNKDDYKHMKPRIRIEDPNIKEIKSIIVRYKLNGASDYTIKNDIKVPESPIPNTNVYEVVMDDLKEGKYSDFEVIVSSNFGEKKEKYFHYYYKNKNNTGTSFIVDNTSPVLNSVIYNNNTKKTMFVEKHGVYNFNTLMLCSEDFQNKNQFMSGISTDNIKLTIKKKESRNSKNYIEEYSADNFDIEKVNVVSIGGSYQQLYKIICKNGASIYDDGYYELSYTITDNAGNEGNYSIDYTIDTVKPDINGSVYDRIHNKEVALSGNTGYIDTNNAAFKFSDSNFDSYSINVNHNGNNLYSTSTSQNIKLDNEGKYVFTVTAVDAAGNSSTSVFRIDVDTQSPAIRMDKFLNGDGPVYNTTSPTIRANVNGLFNRNNCDISMTDSMNSIYKYKAEITEKYSGKTWSTVNYDPNSINDIIPAGLSEGAYHIRITAYDRAGHVATSLGRLIMDTGNPYIKIFAPQISNSSFDGQGSHFGKYNNVQYVKPTIEIDDVSLVSSGLSFYITSNGHRTSVTPESISYSKYKVTAQLPAVSREDIYTLEVNANDRAYHGSSSSLKFAIDRTAPTIKFDAGNKNMAANTLNYLTNHYSAFNASFKDYINDLANEAIDYSISVTPVTGGSSGVRNGYALSADNTYEIFITATDKAGNKSTYRTTITVDTVFPILDILGVKDGYYYNKDVSPTWKVDDNTAKILLQLNGYAYDGSKLAGENKYELIITATDPAGNKTSKSVWFVIDKTAPFITIDGIKDKGVYLSGVLPLIKWNDSSSIVSILLNNLDYNGELINKNGIYTLYVKAVDKAGNVAEKVLNFRLNVTKPVIMIDGAKDNGVYTSSVVINFAFKDAVKYEAYLNGKPYNGEVISKPGEYYLKVIAKNEDGGTTVKTIHFTIKDTSDKNSKSFNLGGFKGKGLIISFVGLLAALGVGVTVFMKCKKDDKSVDNDSEEE